MNTVLSNDERNAAAPQAFAGRTPCAGRALGFRGRLALGVSRGGTKSILSTLDYTAPLKVLRPFYLDRRGTAFVYASDASGGLLAGDEAETEATVGRDASLYLTTASASKVGEMPTGHATARLRATVASGGSFEHFPEPMILFRTAHLIMQTTVDVQAGATLAMAEVFAGGRTHHGETLAFRELCGRTHIRIDGRLALREQYRMRPGATDLTRSGLLEGHACWGTMYVYAAGEALREGLTLAREALSGRCGGLGVRDFGDGGDLRAGVSLHPSGLMAVKALAGRADAISNLFRTVWSALRPRLLGEGLPDVRK